MKKVQVDVAMVCKVLGLGLMLASNVVSGVAEKKQNEAFLTKLFNEKFADKN